MALRSHPSVFYIIIIAQFCGTSLWFAGNAVLPQLQEAFQWEPSSLGYITGATQAGFISGTLAFAILGLADRFSPSRLFLICSFLASASNVVCLTDLSSFTVVLISRVATGFFLAGIYPVGMKITADYSEKGLGHWLGALVGALVIGTALPHGLKSIPGFINTEILLISVSALAIFGGLLIGGLVPDGPFRKESTRFSLPGLGSVFRIPAFRIPAFGYFGHMWELYAFWAFVPFIINIYEIETGSVLPAFMPAVVIAAGALGSILGGHLSRAIGSYRVALYSLMFSGLCCLLSPLLFSMTPMVFSVFMISWGITVVSDSPQFSALVANNSPGELKGSAITIVTSIGFLITIISIQLLNMLQDILSPAYLFLFLLPGPLFGVAALLGKEKKV